MFTQKKKNKHAKTTRQNNTLETKAVPPQATVADRPIVTPNPIDLGNLSNFSDILASNNIPFNTSVMLDHQYLPIC